MIQQQSQIIRALIIEDEVRSTHLLNALLGDFAPDINVVATADRVEEAIATIVKEKPELIFLDIELCGELAFRILDRVSWRNFQLIFITAHESYALKAIRYSAADYLLKPVAPEELALAIQKVREKKALNMDSEQMDVFREHLNSGGEHKRITLPTLHGFVIEEMDNILSIEADGNYSIFQLKGGATIMVSGNIQAYESILEQGSFFRIHRSFIVNLKQVKKYMKGRGGQVVLSDGRLLPVAIRKKEGFISRLKQM